MFTKIPSVFKHRKVCYIALHEIHPATNYNINDLTELKKDILKNGLLFPLEISNRWSMKCLTGNQRLLILRSLDIEKVPVIYITDREKHSQVSHNQRLHSKLPHSITPLFRVTFISGHKRVLKKRLKKKRN